MNVSIIDQLGPLGYADRAYYLKGYPHRGSVYKTWEPYGDLAIYRKEGD